jgi:hypothetical protein
MRKYSTRLTPLQDPAFTQPCKLDMSLIALDLFRQGETHFLCDALIAATFSFFSAIRFARRALKKPNVSFRGRKRGTRRTHTPPSAPSDVPAGEA